LILNIQALKRSLFVAVLSLVILHVSAAVKPKTYRVLFYNLENFYDLVDDTLVNDDDFTPAGKSKWTKERYETKKINMAKVVSAMCDSVQPLFFGVSEIEKKEVLQDWIATTNLKQFNLEVIEFNSPDQRGIDVALMYNSKLFKLISSEAINVTFPFDTAYKTRDILYVKGVVDNHEVHVLVTHASSRRTAAGESLPRRLYSAAMLRNKAQEILKKDPKANIVIMGDFNDTPHDASVADSLGAQKSTAGLKPGQLYNAMSKLDNGSGNFTYNHQGQLDILDQFITSEAMVNKQCTVCLKDNSAHIFSRDWMLYKTEKNGMSPNRTYAGPKYIGGFSDHLPIYMDLQIK
jgi:exonuclease III